MLNIYQNSLCFLLHSCYSDCIFGLTYITKRSPLPTIIFQLLMIYCLTFCSPDPFIDLATTAPVKKPNFFLHFSKMSFFFISHSLSIQVFFFFSLVIVVVNRDCCYMVSHSSQQGTVIRPGNLIAAPTTNEQTENDTAQNVNRSTGEREKDVITIIIIHLYIIYFRPFIKVARLPDLRNPL